MKTLYCLPMRAAAGLLLFGAAVAHGRVDAQSAWQQVGNFASELADADTDGVADIDDNCPGTVAETPTPRGPVPTQVDGCGCPIDPCGQDADRDGVPDCQDQCAGTFLRLAVKEDGCPAPLTRTLRVRLDVKFAFDRAEIDPAFTAQLVQLRDALRRFPALRVRLEGHTDALGGAPYNQALSEARARACRDFLLQDGSIAPERVEAVGFGEAQPLASNATDAGMALNRRTVAAIDFDETIVPANDQPPPFEGMAPDVHAKAVAE